MSSKEELRKRIIDRINQSKQGGRKQDPAEYRPPKAEGTEVIKTRFFVLPPLKKGDPCSTGKAANTMEDWAVTVGDHWIDKKPYPCPRIYDGGQCPICEVGFTILRELKENNAPKEELSKTAKLWLPQTKWMVNIYFPTIKINPDDLQGTVKFMQLPKTIYDKMEACLMADGPGNDTDQPEAHGVFFWYDDQCTIPGGFQFSLDARHKGGFNNYEQSKFINVNGPMPLVCKKGTGEAGVPPQPDMAKIDKIMSERHDLIAKCPARNPTELQAIVDKLLKKSEDEVVFNDEKPSPAPTTRPAAKAPVVEEKDDSESEAKDEEEEAPKPAPAKAAAPAPVKKSPPKQETADDSDSELDSLLKSIKTGK